MERRLGIVIADMGDPECNEEQEDVFEDSLEAEVPSAQGVEDSSDETQQVGHSCLLPLAAMRPW